MTRGRASLAFATTLLACAAVAGLGANPAGAAAPDQQGWWTTLNQGNVPEVGKPAPAPTPPDVPAKGLLVQGPSASTPASAPTAAAPTPASSSPVAYAGLVYYLPIGATASTLTLTVAANSASTPMATLELCPLVNPVLNPEQGGPIADAPPYDCTHNVSAGPNGSAYQFQVSDLVTDGSLAVAILPTSPADRVVLDQPDANSLTEQAAPASAVPQPQDSSSGATPISALSTPLPEALPSFGISPYGALPGPTPAPSAGGSAAPAAPPAAPAPAAAAPRSSSAIPVFGTLAGDSASPLTVALVMAGLMGGAALWFVAGRRRSDEAELAEVPVSD